MFGCSANITLSNYNVFRYLQHLVGSMTSYVVLMQGSSISSCLCDAVRWYRWNSLRVKVLMDSLYPSLPAVVLCHWRSATDERTLTAPFSLDYVRWTFRSAPTHCVYCMYFVSSQINILWIVCSACIPLLVNPFTANPVKALHFAILV